MSNGPEGVTDFGVYAGVMGLGNGTPSAYLITPARLCNLVSYQWR